VKKACACRWTTSAPGYSSLGRLQRLPVDVLKIDKAFVEDIGTGAKQGALVRAIVMMAHSLDLTVVAEGVENEVQRAFLERYGCDLYQGHLLTPPLPASEMGQYLKARHARVPRRRRRGSLPRATGAHRHAAASARPSIQD
jgi:sensor c-di-GMP phosphodiesterase-like protein